MFFAVVVRAESQPSGSDFEIGPGLDEIGAGAEDGVVMIIHDGIGADVDGEDAGEEVQSVKDPSFAVGEVAAGDGIEAGEESAADAPSEAVIDTDFAIFDVGTAWKPHGLPPIRIPNDRLTN